MAEILELEAILDLENWLHYKCLVVWVHAIKHRSKMVWGNFVCLRYNYLYKKGKYSGEFLNLKTMAREDSMLFQPKLKCTGSTIVVNFALA